MKIVIYQSLIIHIIVMINGVHAISVVIKENVTGILGENGTTIECSYTKENVLRIDSVSYLALNKSTTTFVTIATYLPGLKTLLTPEGQYLKGRVTLINITEPSTKAVMIFNKLLCIDDTFYRCNVRFVDSGGRPGETMSKNISISVQVTPSKPDRIFWMKASPDSSSTTPKVPITSTTSSQYSAVTTKLNETFSTMDGDEQNDIITSNHSTLQTTDKNTTSSTPSDEDLFTDTSYRTTTYSIQQTTTAAEITEGDNITIVCSGDVGKPAAKHVFQKYRSGNILPMNYTATETSISEISDNCSYYRTSNLTFQVTADDNNATIRCVVNSSMEEPDMFAELEPLEVYYEVSMPTITKYPNDSYYIVDEATSINLTCKSDGNPKPNYQWYKENDTEPVSTSANWTITDINVTNSGVYTCNVSNTFNGKTHRNAKHVQINIMNKAYTTRITLEHSSTLDDVPTTQSSSTCSTSCVGKKEEESKGNFDGIPTTQSSSICSSSCVDKKDEDGNLGLIASIVGPVVGTVVVVIVVIMVIIACRRRKCKSPTFKNVSNNFDDSKPKPVTESRTGDYDYIALEDDPPKPNSYNNGLEVEDITKHNAEYLKKEEEEKKKNESNTPPQPAVYAQVNEASMLRNKQKTDTIDSIGKQEEDTYAETQEGIYDKAGDRRHKENENDEHYDSSNNSSKQNSNDDGKLSIQTSQVGSYANQGFEKDDNRKVATVAPTVRSSSGSQNDEETHSNGNSQSKKGYENISGTDQTCISEKDSSHRTAL